jgi:Tfp pilus assembly protein PilF
MPIVKQYHYANISQRRFIEANSAVTACIAGWISIEAVISLSRVFPYSPVFEILICLFLLSHLCGNLFGKLLFWKLRTSRAAYIITELLFIGICGFLAVKSGTMKTENPLLDVYFVSPLLLGGILMSIPFLAGVKNNYFLKVSCGIFFDEKKGAPGYILLSFLGFSAGAVGLVVSHYAGIPVWGGALPLVVCAVTLPFISAQYNPTPFFAQEITSHDAAPDEEVQGRTRDDLFFLYLNFSYILVYTFLGSILIQRTYGDFLYIKFSYLIMLLLSLCAGYLLSVFLRRSFLPHIYSEVIYPFAFLGLFLLTYLFGGRMPFYKGILLFAPLGILFGATLRHNIAGVLSENDQAGAAKALNISIFILPVPILIALSCVTFTERFFALSIYILAFVGLLIPGIYLSQKKDHQLKKGLYFLFCALSVPLFIAVHLYFAIPFSGRPFIERTSGYEDILRLNYNADYLSKSANISIHKIPLFNANDLTIRSVKSGTAALSLFADTETDSVLFIDGNRTFFDNPIQPLFLKAVRVDYFPKNWAGIVRLPASTARTIATIQKEILDVFRTSRQPFSVIVDIPNLYDQYTNGYRFSDSYYREVKRHLTGKKIFAQSFDTRYCNRYYFQTAVSSFKKEFPYTTAFLFSEQLTLVGACDPGVLSITPDSITRLKKIISGDQSSLFFSEFQCLSHIASSDIADLAPGIKIPEYRVDSMLVRRHIGKILPDALAASYETAHSSGLALVPQTPDRTFYSYLEAGLRSYDKQLTILKQIEKDEIVRDYESETTRLLELRRFGEYDPALRQYASNMLQFKETAFNEYALLYEKGKQWDDAAKIYKAILIINPNNFNANYRMSVISLTLQDINAAFLYLQTAMNLQSNDPNVMHQMGVLLFSTGKYNEALTYLQKAIALQKYDAETYLYTGQCFEELGRLQESLDYYQQALVKDPQNQEIIGALQRLKDKNRKMQDQWKAPEMKNQNEVERGEDFPLPINKSAIDVRLKDDPQDSGTAPQ